MKQIDFLAPEIDPNGPVWRLFTAARYRDGIFWGLRSVSEAEAEAKREGRAEVKDGALAYRIEAFKLSGAENADLP